REVCGHCGADRLEDAQYCYGCGQPFVVSRMDHSAVGIMAAFILLGSLFGYLLIDRVILVRKDDHAHHNHAAAPTDNPRMTELKAKAESGEPAALMDLAEYQIESSVHQAVYLSQAAGTLERLLQRFPSHPYSLRLLGNIYFQLGDHEHSVLFYERYLQQIPNDANVMTDLGTQYFAMGAFERAAGQYRKALELFPDIYHAQFNLSLVYKEMGNLTLSEQARTAAEAIERRVGKTLAPDPDLARLPDGADATPRIAASDPYGSLRIFFAAHPIVGPKMVGFEAGDQGAVLSLRNFPMEAMPPFARQAFDKKVRERLAQIPDGQLTIRDADNGQVMAEYPVP
ncbi:MAG: tetratricopeptide repeat protein, partial [Chromatiales bacterium]|nr:tetratricopeptide repeat protein [Chromatiales bacterium]